MTDTTLANVRALWDEVERQGIPHHELELHFTKSALLTVLKSAVKPTDDIRHPDGVIGIIPSLYGIPVIEHENDDPEMQGESVQLRRKAVSND
jgi:hypothetical protein